MFMPQAQPHMARNYAAPGTARRGARDKENAGALPSKTPVRPALGKAGPSGRALGARTVDRNIQTQNPSEDIAPKRLFQNEKDGKKEKGAPLRLKTPGPRMKTPAPRLMRTPAPQLIYHDEPTPAPLPSAQRTRRRNRASLQSPPHEDADLSLDSILEVAVEPEEEAVVEDDFELEYAPAPVVDVPYVPEWAESVPDVVETMAALSQIRPMSIRTPPSPPPDFAFNTLDSIPTPSITLCPDDDLNHPLLRKRSMASNPQSTKTKDQPVRAPLRPAGGTGNTVSRSALGAASNGTRTGIRPATATGAVRPTTSSAARTRPLSTATSAPKRPASSTAAARSTATTRGPLRAATSAAPRTGSAPTTRVPSQASTAASSTAGTRPVRPATSSAVRTNRPGTVTVARPATATAATRPSSRLPRLGKVVKAPARTKSPGPAMPPAGNDLLNLDFEVLDEKDAKALNEKEDKDAEKEELKVDDAENVGTDEPKNEEPKLSVPVPAATPEPGASPAHPSSPLLTVSRAPITPAATVASASPAAPATPVGATTPTGPVTPVGPTTPALAISPATLHPLQLALTPTSPMSPLMSPRLPTSPLRDEVFDFAALTAALPPDATSTPEEHIEMSPLASPRASPAELVPTPPGGQADHLLITFANRRLARISERTEVDTTFDDTFHTSFDESFDDAGATNTPQN